MVRSPPNPERQIDMFCRRTGYTERVGRGWMARAEALSAAMRQTQVKVHGFCRARYTPRGMHDGAHIHRTILSFPGLGFGIKFAILPAWN